MTYFGKALFITACGFALCACSGESGPPKSEPEAAAEKTAEAPPTKPQGPNYCYGPEYNPEKPFRFVYLNLKIKPEERAEIRAVMKAELEASKTLPQEAQAEAIEPYLAKTQILADLGIQPLADQILPLTATLCNFELYEKDECTGAISRSVSKVDRIADTLAYSAPDGRGRPSRVFISAPDYSDVSIDGPGTTQHWSRTPDGVESFSFKDSISEISWTENPDCSGQMTKRRKTISMDVTWTSPKAGPLAFSYKHCRKEACITGEF